MEKNEKVKFPKYNREEKMSAKFTEEEVNEMIFLRKYGMSYRKIAELFNANPDTVWFAVNKIVAPEKLERRRKRQMIYWNRDKEKEKKKEQRKVSIKRYSVRKRKNKREEMNSYYKGLMRDMRTRVLNDINKSTEQKTN